MKPTIAILTCLLASGLAAAQSPSVIQNTRTTMNAVHDTSAAASNAALGVQDKAPSAASATQTPAKSDGTAVSVKPAVNTHKASAGKGSAGKLKVVAVEKSTHSKTSTAGTKTTKTTKTKTAAGATAAGSTASTTAAADKPAEDEQAAPDKKWSGKRDPFISPVVSRANGPSSCSAGKKCLEIGSINLRGIVHAENGFIAVVSNSLNKAYFLRENDPVFNGYVVKITGDSVVFQETLQDRLGKTFTREVVKKITIPAV